MIEEYGFCKRYSENEEFYPSSDLWFDVGHCFFDCRINNRIDLLSAGVFMLSAITLNILSLNITSINLIPVRPRIKNTWNRI